MSRSPRIAPLASLGLLFLVALGCGSFLWFSQVERVGDRERGVARVENVVRDADLAALSLTRLYQLKNERPPADQARIDKARRSANVALGQLSDSLTAAPAIERAVYGIVAPGNGVRPGNVDGNLDAPGLRALIAEQVLVRRFAEDRLALRRDERERARLAALVSAITSLIALAGLIVVAVLLLSRNRRLLPRQEPGIAGALGLPWRRPTADRERRSGYGPLEVIDRAGEVDMGIAVIPEGGEPPLVNAQMSRMLEDVDLDLDDLSLLEPGDGGRTLAYRLTSATEEQGEAEEATFQLQATRVRAQGLIADVHLLKPVEEHTSLDQAERMLAVASHELRAPASALLGLVESVLDDPEGGVSSVQRMRLELAVRRGISLHRIIDDLLVFSRANAQIALPLYRRRTDLVLLAGDLVESARLEAEQDGIAVELDGESVSANIDPARISQVIGNLLDNAIRFAPRDSSIWVRVSREAGTRQALIEVRDEGPGFSRGAIEGLFVPFRHDGDYPGLGLGLFVVKTIVDAHGGQIEVDSEDGARILIRLPRDIPYDFIPRRRPASG